MQTDANGMKSSDPFEVQRRMMRVGAKKLEAAIGRLADFVG